MRHTNAFLKVAGAAATLSFVAGLAVGCQGFGKKSEGQQPQQPSTPVATPAPAATPDQQVPQQPSTPAPIEQPASTPMPQATPPMDVPYVPPTPAMTPDPTVTQPPTGTPAPGEESDPSAMPTPIDNIDDVMPPATSTPPDMSWNIPSKPERKEWTAALWRLASRA